MSDKGKYYLTTAIAYTSGKPHIGNVYEAVLSDTIVRQKRLEGYDVFFQTGTDEHGQKNEKTAKERGITPKEYVNEAAATVKEQWDLLNVCYDKFIRTTDDYHREAVQKIFKKLYEQGDIYKSKYEGLYCTACEAFYMESQLVDGKCPDCGKEVIPASEEAYFFNMQKYAQRLIDHINSHPNFILPVSRKNEMMNNFLLPGLQDLCVSRTSIKWGIEVDFDPGHVIYVWLDALTNYITGIGYNPDGSTPQFDRLWPADLHVIGKDIARFHVIYWPIFLMALDLPLPETVFGHPWLLMNGIKMSKSTGNLIYADDLVSVFGVDAVRYYVLHEMPYDQDGTITWELMTERVNSDLANTIGNLVNRTVTMVNKYFGGVVSNTGVTEPVDEELKMIAETCRDKVKSEFDSLHIADALSEVLALFRRCNKYIDETTPWILAKDTDTLPRLGTVLYNLIDSIRIGASLLSVFLPETAEKILRQIGAGQTDFDNLDKTGLYPSGDKVTDTPEILFERLDLDEVISKAEEIMGVEDNPLRDEIHGVAKIGIDDFQKVDLRVAEIIDCEPIKKAKKLLKLTLDDGTGVPRTVASGIALWYSPEDLKGHKIIVVSNLKPATLMGIESQGMILAADGKDGEVSVIFADNLPNGSKVR